MNRTELILFVAFVIFIIILFFIFMELRTDGASCIANPLEFIKSKSPQTSCFCWYSGIGS